MLKEAIEKLQSLSVNAADIITKDIDGRIYTEASLKRVRKSEETAPSAMTVTTLTGLVDLFHKGLGRPWGLHEPRQNGLE